MLAVLGVAGLALAIDKLSGSGGAMGPASASAAEPTLIASTTKARSESAGAARRPSISDRLSSWEQAHAGDAPEDAFAPQAWMAPHAGIAPAQGEPAPTVQGFRVSSVLTKYGARLRREGDAAGSQGRLLRIGEQVTWSESLPVRVALVEVTSEGVVVEIDGARTELRLAEASGGHAGVAARPRPETTASGAR